MYSLDFEEFLWAKGYDSSFVNEILEHMQAKYKIYFADSGLLVAMLGDAAQEDLRMNKNPGIFIIVIVSMLGSITFL